MSKGKDLLEKAISADRKKTRRFPVDLDFLPLSIGYVIGKINARQYKEAMQDHDQLFDLSDNGLPHYCVRVMREAYFKGKLSFNYDDNESEEADKIGRQSIK